MANPIDAVSIQIGQLFINLNKKMKKEFQGEIDNIKIEVQKSLDELEQLEQKIQELENEKTNATQQLIAKKQAHKRKFGSPN
ncbi:unnamed protein product [Rotaria sp. Silwood2]|nr:unnamed protein product [Rotaria sp. Silwood2]